MRTLRDAARLLSAARNSDGLLAIAHILGFRDSILPLDEPARARLRLPPLQEARLARGDGALRALVVVAPPGVALRTVLGEVARALAATTSHVLWIVFAASSDGEEISIACWTSEHATPRVGSLHARPSQLVASDAETLCSLEAAAEGDDLAVHTRWCEVLGRDALCRRFYRTLEQRVTALAGSLPYGNEADRGELALLATSRLLFLAFLQAKGWLDGDRAFLERQFDACVAAGGGFHRRVMLPLFFGTLNTPPHCRAAAARRFGRIPFLNGGLFTRTALERRYPDAHFSDATIGEVFARLLGAYRFTAREDSPSMSEVAIDPEMLGHAFESLMSARARRNSGAYYTPQLLVAHVTDHALASVLGAPPLDRASVQDALNGVQLDHIARAVLASRLDSITVLDPACGSGAFLVYVLERLTRLRRVCGDVRDLAAIRRDVLTRCLHGVDVNPMAVWLCELRLWLSVVIESEETRISSVPPLPNLDCNIRMGDSLAGEAFSEPPALLGPSMALSRLRQRYARAAGARKAPLRRAIAREERLRALAAIDRKIDGLRHARRERLIARRTPDLFGERQRESAVDRTETQSLRRLAAALRRDRARIADGGALPFSFPSHFAHVHSRGGFDLVIGNPPWVRLHNIPSAARIELRSRFTVFRDPGWRAENDATVHGFSPQVDLAALFVERGIALAAPAGKDKAGGTVALLLPAKLWRSLSGGGVRRLLAKDTRVERLEDWTEAPCTFDAAVYPSLLIATRDVAASFSPAIAVRRRTMTLEWPSASHAIPLDVANLASPWLVLPPEVRVAFDHLREHGVPLSSTSLGHATLGVKCGCNDAFMLEERGRDGELVSVAHRGRHGAVERALLRPLLRGEAVTPWRVARAGDAILWTHAPSGGALRVLPSGAARWLAPWRRRLRARTDLRSASTWWMLFRTEGADDRRVRVVWSDFGRAPRAAVLAAGDPTVPLNSCYVLPCDDPADALGLAALLNSALAASWLNAVAEPARGGWRRYLSWTVGLLPLPTDWPRARSILAPLAERALLGDPPSDSALLQATCRAYRVRHEDIAPLIAWCH